MMGSADELREAIAEYNRARTALTQALERAQPEETVARARARVAAAEAKLAAAQSRARRDAS